MEIKDIAAAVGITLDANGKPESTRQNVVAALRANARMMREGPHHIGIAANEAASTLSFAAYGKGWISREAVFASLKSARADSQTVSVPEAYARHAERIADLIEQSTTDTSAAQRLFADPQPHRFAKEIM